MQIAIKNLKQQETKDNYYMTIHHMMDVFEELVPKTKNFREALRCVYRWGGGGGGGDFFFFMRGIKCSLLNL